MKKGIINNFVLGCINELYPITNPIVNIILPIMKPKMTLENAYLLSLFAALYPKTNMMIEITTKNAQVTHDKSVNILNAGTIPINTISTTAINVTISNCVKKDL